MTRIEVAMFGRDLRQLFDGGGVVGLTDAQLVDRIARRDESAESAFEAILTRHGPAVLACCRRVLGRCRGGRGRLPGDVPRSVSPRRIDLGRGVPRPLAAARGPQGGPEGAAGRGPPARARTPRRAIGARGRRVVVLRRPPAGARRGRSLAREVPRSGPPLLLRGADPRRRGGVTRLAGRDGPRAARARQGNAPHAVDATGRRHRARGPAARWPRRATPGPTSRRRSARRRSRPRSAAGRSRPGSSRWRRRSPAAWPHRPRVKAAAIVLAVVSMISAGAGIAAIGRSQSHAQRPPGTASSGGTGPRPECRSQRTGGRMADEPGRRDLQAAGRPPGSRPSRTPSSRP